jgi:toxin ParE1/3/4
MKWQVFSRPEAETEVIQIAAWYDSRMEGLGDRFVDELLAVLDQLTINPFLHCYPRSFPYRVIYEVNEDEKVVVVAAVLHAARHDRESKRRI